MDKEAILPCPRFPLMGVRLRQRRRQPERQTGIDETGQSSGHQNPATREGESRRQSLRPTMEELFCGPQDGRYRVRHGPLKGLSRVLGNSHARFLEGWVVAI